MKLNFEEIKKYTVGAVATEVKEDGMHFYKCTPEQIAVFRAEKEDFGKGAKGTTGVHIDFHTDAKSMVVSVSGGGKYEIQINGLLQHQFNCKEVEEFSVVLPVSEELTRVTVNLASHGTGGVIRGIELVGATKVLPHKYDCKMLFLGDSITQGWNAAFDTLSYTYRVANFFNAEALNQGIGGSRFMWETVIPLPFDPDFVFVAYGTNDFDYFKRREDPIADFRASLVKYLDRIQELYGRKKVFILSPIPRIMHNEDMIALFESLRQTIAEEAIARGFTHIDGYILLPMMTPLYADEKLHPNDNGFSVFAENLIKQIGGYIKE